MHEAPANDGHETVSPPQPREGSRIGTPDFEAETTAYLQSRLRLMAGVSASIATALFVVGRSVTMLGGAPKWADPGAPHVIVHAAGLVSAVAAFVLLWRRRFTLRGLLAMDAVATAIPIAICVATYAILYDKGIELAIPVAGLFLLARAIVVPSTPLRTVVLSAPVVPAFLAVQLAHGALYGPGGTRVPYEAVAPVLAWYHAYLVLTIALAAVASRVNFDLRRKAYEARKLGQYVLESRIGAGGMGEVYRARHALLRRPAAIKFLRGEMSTREAVSRFEREVTATSRLSHPNTVAIYDYGRAADGSFYYAMELLDGADLERIVAATGPLPPGRAIHVLAEACRALAEAHDLGLVHRDLKPSNIMLCRQGGEFDAVKVLDFGLVKDLRGGEPALSFAGAVCGNPHTIAPEVILGAPPGPAADLYALGAIGCFLLTGKGLFDATTWGELISHHLHSEPVAPRARNPALPADLEGLLLRCVQKAPTDRPPDVRALRMSLLACADTGGWDQERAAAWWKDHRSAVALPGA